MKPAYKMLIAFFAVLMLLTPVSAVSVSPYDIELVSGDPVAQEVTVVIVGVDGVTLKSALESTSETIVVIESDQTISETSGTLIVNGIHTLVSNGRTVSRGAGFTGTMFSISSGASLTLSDDNGYLTLDGTAFVEEVVDEIVNKVEVNSNGPIFSVGSDSMLAIDDSNGDATVTIGSNKFPSGNGGAISVNGGTFTMNGGKITGCSATSGAGIYLENGILTMAGGAIDNNTSSFVGGGVVVKGTSIFTMSGGEITNNKAKNGAGVRLENGATLQMSGDTTKISKNETTCNTVNGGNGAGVCIKSASFIMSGGEISENESHSSFTGSNNGCGGGVYLFCDTIESNFTMNGGRIENNTVDGRGGQIHLNDSNSSFFIASGVISSTESGIEKKGSAIYIAENNVSSTFTGNVYIVGELYVSSGVMITRTNSFSTTNDNGESFEEFELNKKGESSRDIYFENGFANDEEYVSNVFSSMSPGVTDKETLYLSSGGSDSGSGDIGDPLKTLYGAYSAFSNMSFKGKSSVDLKIVIVGSVEILRNDVITIDRGSFSYNFVDITIEKASSMTFERYLSDTSGYDGNMFTVNGTLKMDGVKITGSKDVDRNVRVGAVFSVTSAGKLTLGESGTVDVGSNNGQGIGCEGKLTIGQYCVIHDCTSNVNGGGIAFSGSKCNIKGTISNCTSIGLSGGGIYQSGGVLTISGGTITDCEAKDGGGVFIEMGTFNMEGGSITRNEAENGGGIRAAPAITTSRTVKCTMNGGTISENTVSNNGSAVLLRGVNVSFIMNGGEICGNTNTDDSIFKENKSRSAVHVFSGSVFTMNGGDIYNNTSENQLKYGAGSYGLQMVVFSDGKLVLNGGSITDSDTIGGSPIGSTLSFSKATITVDSAYVCQLDIYTTTSENNTNNANWDKRTVFNEVPVSNAGYTRVINFCGDSENPQTVTVEPLCGVDGYYNDSGEIPSFSLPNDDDGTSKDVGDTRLRLSWYVLLEVVSLTGNVCETSSADVTLTITTNMRASIDVTLSWASYFDFDKPVLYTGGNNQAQVQLTTYDETSLVPENAGGYWLVITATPAPEGDKTDYGYAAASKVFLFTVMPDTGFLSEPSADIVVI